MHMRTVARSSRYHPMCSSTQVSLETSEHHLLHTQYLVCDINNRMFPWPVFKVSGPGQDHGHRRRDMLPRAQTLAQGLGLLRAARAVRAQAGRRAGGLIEGELESWKGKTYRRRQGSGDVCGAKRTRDARSKQQHEERAAGPLFLSPHSRIGIRHNGHVPVALGEHLHSPHPTARRQAGRPAQPSPAHAQKEREAKRRKSQAK